MRHFKKFTKTTELTPVQQELSENCSVQFIHDESGVDWYVLQKLFQPDTLKIQYDKTGLIIAADKDATKLFPGFAPIFPDTCYHLTHYWPAAADIPVASDNPVHYADAIRYNARTPLQGSLLPLTRLV